MKSDKIIAWSDLATLRDDYNEKGLKVVQCHGCFDIVHPGHIRYLRFARSQGDVLVVSLTSDAHIAKGFDRPYITEELRAENLAAFEFVDHVVIDDHPTAIEVLSELRPDVYVKGKEYESKSDARFLEERKLVEQHGGRVIFSSGDVVFSSTHLLQFLRGDEGLVRDKKRFFCERNDITHERCLKAVDDINGAKFLVVGDAIIDRYIRCEDATLASEQPILSVNPVAETEYAGGAALIAAQLAQLGARVTLLSAYANGPDADRFEELLEGFGVDVDVVGIDSRPVFTKSRYLVDNRKVFKVNQGGPAPLSTVGVQAFRERLSHYWRDQDHVLVTDFGYGMFGHAVIDTIADLADKTSVGYSADVSKAGAPQLLRFRNVTVASPTEDELRHAFGDFDSGLSNLASRFIGATNAGKVAITLGSMGALLLSPDGSPTLKADYLPALSHNPLDVVGAGDVFFAAFIACRVTGADDALALFVASALAAAHIHQQGNEPTPRDVLLRGLAWQLRALHDDEYLFGRDF